MENILLSYINNNQYNDAISFFEKNIDSLPLNENICIIAATIYSYFSNQELTLYYIEKGLELNPKNYELYMMLGNYYFDININLSFLCYENAEYFCEIETGIESDDYAYIHTLKNSCYSHPDFSVKPVSFVILSYNTLDVTKVCLKSIRLHCKLDTYEIIVIDNASTDGSREWLASQSDIKFIANTENIGFPAGCNQGIELSTPDNDIFLLNNDTIMMSNSLYTLRMGLYAERSIGAAGSVTNYAVNHQMVVSSNISPADAFNLSYHNNIPRRNSFEYKLWLVGFALLLKRPVLKKVGLLDTLYSPGHYEDNDLCIRIAQAGYSNILCYNSFIFHWGSKSFNTLGNEQFCNLSNTNRDKFKAKWGFNPDYYSHIRQDIIPFISDDHDTPLKILEIGCGAGATLAHIKYLFPNSKVHGIELVQEIVSISDKNLNIICGNIENMILPYEKHSFDYIICGDVLEHLLYPQNTLSMLREYLKLDGYILASLPNLMNAKVIYNLLCGNFTYTDSGILDKTHVRFFTLKEIIKLFEEQGFTLENIEYSVSPTESTETNIDFFKQLLQIEGIAPKEEFDAYQYLVKAKKKSTAILH